MNIRSVVAAGLCFAAWGCATQPVEDATFKQGTTGTESAERSRARIHTELAANYYEIGNMGVALEEVKEAVRSDPTYGPAYNISGLIYARLNEDPLAEQNFQRAIAINSSDYDALNNYGLFLCERRRERESIKYFLAAVRNPLYPFPDRSYLNAGACARRGGDLATAEEYLQMALKLRPANSQALYQLADMSYARGDFPGAKTYLNRLTQTAAPSPEVLWLGVRTARRIGDRDAEASYARQLRNRFPESAEVRALNAGRYE